MYCNKRTIIEITDKHIDLSIVIVNYNVCYFLEQCLNSIFTKDSTLSLEVFVVDNNSVDQSMSMVKTKFPQVKCIENKENLGFSRANNQAIEISKGKYILLLNPDTVLEENTLQICFDFMENKENAGALGVRMIDGKGNFLPESKRGFPSPMVSFYKIFGLSRLFPKSKIFGKYHLGYLNENEINEVDVLSGAFMFMRKKTIHEVGSLDNAFFMYGEDIDLSYRIQLGGYKNFYLPTTKIIHYKGESTKKGSVNYVFIFYKAMIIFARKHLKGRNMTLFVSAIYLAIYLRASISIVKRIWNAIKWPILDVSITLLGLYALTNQWKMNDIHFPKNVFIYQIPGYTFVWTFFSWIFGVYDRVENTLKIWRGWFVSTLLILVVYGLLPKEYQFSRLFILIGSVWYITQFFLLRIFYTLIQENRLGIPKFQSKIFGIVSSKEEFDRIRELVTNTYSKKASVHHISIEHDKDANLGVLQRLPEIIKAYKLNELIFSAKDIESSSIIDLMAKISAKNLDFKIAQPDTHFLIGSNSIHTSGDFYSLDYNRFSMIENLRIKRLFDLFFATSLLILSPIILWFQVYKANYLRNMFEILVGNKTLIGVQKTNLHSKLKPAILNAFAFKNTNGEIDFHKIEILYSKNYSFYLDIKILFRNFRKLGNVQP